MTTDLKEKDAQATTSRQSENDISRYFGEGWEYPRLTQQQEQALAKRCAAGDEEAIRVMVGSNLGLVIAIARNYAGRGVPMMDLVQEGSIGLLTAAKKFDETLQYRFSTYAAYWIRHSIHRYLENQMGLIRVPRHTAQQIRKLQKAASQLRQDGNEPTVENLAQMCEMSVEKVREYLALIPEICSLDAPAGENAQLQQMLEDAQTQQPLQEMVRRELKETMELLLAKLTNRQQQVLHLRFGMADGTCYSFEKIGAILGISKERARQIEKQAIEKLYCLGTDMGLEDFLE